MKYRNSLEPISMNKGKFIGFTMSIFLFLGLMYIYTELGLIGELPAIIEYPTIFVCIYLIMRLVSKPLIKWDQDRFYRQFAPGEQVFITHLGTKEVINKKLSSGELFPFPSKYQQRYQKILRKYGWIDHHTDVTWVTYGRTIGGSGLIQGNPNKFEKGIVLKVNIEDLKFPSGFVQSYFGTAHMVLEKTIKLDGSEKVYESKSSEWVTI